MPDDSRKNQDTKKKDPKEQRKPRNSRNKQDRKVEKMEDSKPAPKVIVPQKPPVYEDPGPEFYKNLKRETEDILKITEEENSKYKKKEIQSNWAKYEMPIESYDDVEEQDDGADYEKLIQAPLSIGGHFQFKHEKSWDVSTGPSLYDKYFEINMDNLSLAMSTIPFYERNGVDQTLFSENDMLTMNNRATKYKQKYYGDKSYSTSETEAQDKILGIMKQSLSKSNNGTESIEMSIETSVEVTENMDIISEPKDDIDFTFEKTDVPSINENTDVNKSIATNVTRAKSIEAIDELVIVDTAEKKQEMPTLEIVDSPIAMTEKIIEKQDEIMKVPVESKSVATEVKDVPAETKKNPVIESPEDLEKWLDDFLDG